MSTKVVLNNILNSLTKINIDDSDHLSLCIKFYGFLFLQESKFGIVNYNSKFKLKEKKNKTFKKLGYGIFELNYKKITFYIEINKLGDPVGVEHDTKMHNELFIYIDKSDFSILDDFFDEASKYYIDNILDKKKETSKTTIYIWDDYWETMEKRIGRKLSNIYLGGLEIDIYEKIKHFLCEDTKKMYVDLGIPYKYNILFHGLPGTGKSSLIFSLASELNMDVALLHFVNDMTDVDFMRALRRIPDNTILVLEDIDVLFEARKKSDENKTSISFSGILNCLDGISHIENQLIFMTTNCKMVLDKALTRPGRIDMDIEFKYTTKKQIKTMFEKFLPKQSHKFNDFYKEIKHLKITTAILQQYFFSNILKDNILETIDELKEICNKNIYEYKKETLYT